MENSGRFQNKEKYIALDFVCTPEIIMLNVFGPAAKGRLTNYHIKSSENCDQFDKSLKLIYFDNLFEMV